MTFPLDGCEFKKQVEFMQSQMDLIGRTFVCIKMMEEYWLS